VLNNVDVYDKTEESVIDDEFDFLLENWQRRTNRGFLLFLIIINLILEILLIF